MKRLQLKKEVIARLDDDQMSQMKGGMGYDSYAVVVKPVTTPTMDCLAAPFNIMPAVGASPCASDGCPSSQCPDPDPNQSNLCHVNYSLPAPGDFVANVNSCTCQAIAL